MVDLSTVIIKFFIASLLLFFVVEAEIHLENKVVKKVNQFDVLFLTTIMAVDIIGIYLIIQFVYFVRILLF